MGETHVMIDAILMLWFYIHDFETNEMTTPSLDL